MTKRPKLKMLQPRLRAFNTSIATPAPKVGEPFHKSKPWRDLMDEIIKERGRRCEDPQCSVPGGRTEGQIYGDHIHELKDGGAPLDKRNVMLRCAPCHGKKTAIERQRRLARPLRPIA